MARARLLKPGFFTNELLAELPFEGRLLFAGLWTLADREGRLEDRPRRIKAALFPFDEVDVDGLLTALESKGFIERYASGVMALVQIAKFSDHQTPHHREPASDLPGPAGAATDISGSSRAVAVTGNGSSSVTGNGSVSPEALTRSVPVVGFAFFPVVGKSNGGRWELDESQVADWEQLYPNLDVRGEMNKALAWAEANPGRRKTAKGMPAFLVNWLSRATDRRGPSTGDFKGPERRESAPWRCSHQPHCGNRDWCAHLDSKAKAS